MSAVQTYPCKARRYHRYRNDYRSNRIGIKTEKNVLVEVHEKDCQDKETYDYFFQKIWAKDGKQFTHYHTSFIDIEFTLEELNTFWKLHLDAVAFLKLKQDRSKPIEKNLSGPFQNISIEDVCAKGYGM